MHLAGEQIQNENPSLGWTTSLQNLKNSTGEQRAIWGELLPHFFCGELCCKLSEVLFFPPITLGQSLPSLWSFGICGAVAPSRAFGPSHFALRQNVPCCGIALFAAYLWFNFSQFPHNS